MENPASLVSYAKINIHHIQGFYKENLFCDAKYDENQKLSLLNWYGYVPEEAIISTYMTVGYFAKQNNWQVVKTLTDISKMEGSFHKTNEWLTKNYLPKMVEKGFKYSAVVNAKDFFARLAMEDQKELINNLYTNIIFDDYDEAYQWIINQQTK